MISFLGSPKGFSGPAFEQQKNAIRNWLTICPDAEVILYGNSAGTAEASEELGVRHIPDVESTETGIPYFGAIANHAAAHAHYDVQVYLNCDILLTEHLLKTIRRIDFQKFLVIGQRIDLAEGVNIGCLDHNIISKLEMLSKNNQIILHPPAGSDYFIFRRGMWDRLPQVIIGRGGYDTALIAYCLQQRIPVIDATLGIIALHQYHDYSHISGGMSEVFTGEDALKNSTAYQGQTGLSLEDAGWFQAGNKLTRNWARGDWLRAFETNLRVVHGLNLPAYIIRQLSRITYRLKKTKIRKITIQEIFKELNCDESVKS
jgi:hypothetical protein